MCTRRMVLIISVSASLACRGVETMQPPSQLANADEEVPPPPPEVKDDPACKLFKWPLAADQAAEILKRTNMFANAGIYLGEFPPPQIAAFNVLMDQAHPLTYFDDIARAGGPAGRLYALCAFQLLDSTRRLNWVAVLGADHTKVFTQIGCIGADEAVSDVADRIERYSMGEDLRSARDRTYRYFGRPANICLQATVRQ